MLKLLTIFVLTLSGQYLVTDGKSPSTSELNKVADTFAQLLTKKLLYKQLQDVNVVVSLTQVKLKEFKNPTIDIKLDGSRSITLALYGVSVTVSADWSYERSVTGGVAKDDGSLTASTKAAVKLDIRPPSWAGGNLTVDCFASTSEFHFRNNGQVSNNIYGLLQAAFRNKVKPNLGEVFCQSARDVVNANEVKDVLSSYLSN